MSGKVSRRQQNLEEEQFMIPKKLTPQQELDAFLQKLSSFFQYILLKLESLVWVVAAIFVIYQTNFFKVLFTHPDVNEFFLDLTSLCVGINTTLALYAVVYVPYVLRVNQPIDEFAPRVIYLACISGLLSFFTCMLAGWPVWGWKILPIQIIIILGSLNSAQFLPNHEIGSLLYGLTFIIMFYSEHLISHDGLWH